MIYENPINSGFPSVFFRSPAPATSWPLWLSPRAGAWRIASSWAKAGRSDGETMGKPWGNHGETMGMWISRNFLVDFGWRNLIFDGFWWIRKSLSDAFGMDFVGGWGGFKPEIWAYIWVWGFKRFRVKRMVKCHQQTDRNYDFETKVFGDWTKAGIVVDSCFSGFTLPTTCPATHKWRTPLRPSSWNMSSWRGQHMLYTLYVYWIQNLWVYFQVVGCLGWFRGWPWVVVRSSWEWNHITWSRRNPFFFCRWNPTKSPRPIFWWLRSPIVKWRRPNFRGYP